MKSARRNLGVSLVELMIALAIGMVLLLGLVEVFSASRTAYQMAEGLGRVQENGRFATDFLQRDIRMVGHMGCVNDQARFLTNPVGFRNIMDTAKATHAQLDFSVAITGYEAAGTAPKDNLQLPATGAWSGAPALPDFIKNLTPIPAPGSDVLLLRYFSSEGVPVTSYTAGTQTTITFPQASWDNAVASDGYTDKTTTGLVAIADCLNATVFQVTDRPSDGTITVKSGGLNTGDLSTDTYMPGQAFLYRGEVAVYYIGVRNGESSLYRARFAAPFGTDNVVQIGNNPEELVSGIENMQLLFGTDAQTDMTRAPSGYIAGQDVAKASTPWQRVGLVQVALLARSAPSAGAQKADSNGRNLKLLGVNVISPEPDDHRLRTPYETTIALRNRLYGN